MELRLKKKPTDESTVFHRTPLNENDVVEIIPSEGKRLHLEWIKGSGNGFRLRFVEVPTQTQ